MKIMSFIGDILGRLQAGGFPEAIVAGGALRDVENGREEFVKDIDVFIEDRPMYLWELKRALAGFQHRVVVTEHAAQYMQFESVACVHEFWEDHNTIPIQVIVMSKAVIPDCMIERHDFGICQIAWDGKKFFRSHHYDTDKANKSFTLVRCRDNKDYWRSMKRWQRLQTKYQDWVLIA